MSQIVLKLLQDLLTAVEPAVKAYIVKLLQELDASVTNTFEKFVIEAVLKAMGA